MDPRRVVLKETAIVAVGELLCSAVMVGVFAAFGFFQLNVLWGALVGSLVMTANYFFMAITVNLAADRAEKGEVQQAKKMVQLSSTVRLVAIGVAMVVGVKLGANVIALVLPLAFLRPVLMVTEFFRKKGE